MAIPTFKGIITVVVTPFDQKGAVSFDTLGRHIDFLISNGVQAILPGGSTGEYYAQTLDERKEVLRFVAKHVAGRVPLYAGTNSARRPARLRCCPDKPCICSKPIRNRASRPPGGGGAKVAPQNNMVGSGWRSRLGVWRSPRRR